MTHPLLLATLLALLLGAPVQAQWMSAVHDTVFMPTAAIGELVHATVEIQNDTTDLPNIKLSIIGDDAPYFSLRDGDSTGTIWNDSIAYVTIGFRPARLGVHTVTFRAITTLDTLVYDTIHVVILGTGDTASTFFSAHPGSIDATADVGGLDTKTVTLTNTSNAAITCSQFGALHLPFSLAQDSDSMVVIPPKDSVTVTIRYTPTAGGNTDDTLIYRISGQNDKYQVSCLLHGTATIPIPDPPSSIWDVDTMQNGNQFRVRRAGLAQSRTATLFNQRTVTDTFDIMASNPAFTADPARVILPAKTTASVRITYMPTDENDVVDSIRARSVGKSDETALHVFGSVDRTPWFSVDPGGFTFRPDTTQKTFMVRNDIDTAITVTISALADIFEVSQTSITLAPGESLPCSVTCYPNEAEQWPDDTPWPLVLTDNAGHIRSVSLTYRTSSAPSVTLLASDMSGAPGKGVRLLIRNASAMLPRIAALRITMEFNASVLVPSFPVGALILSDMTDGGIRRVRLETNVISHATSQMAIEPLPFVCAIGDAVTSYVSFPSVTFMDDAGLELSLRSRLDNVRVTILDNRTMNTSSGGLGITVQPNPVVSSCTVTLSGATEPGKLSVYTMEGVLVSAQDVPATSSDAVLTLDMASVPLGSYIIRYTSASHSVIRYIQKR